MEYLYTCDLYNPYISEKIHAIVNESNMITSSAYLHTFVNTASNECYHVISDRIGISMPCLVMENELIIGTARYVYFICAKSKMVTHKIIVNSPCILIKTVKDKIIIVCENDIMLISAISKNDISIFNFDDIIIDYVICDNCVTVHLMEGKQEIINLFS